LLRLQRPINSLTLACHWN